MTLANADADPDPPIGVLDAREALRRGEARSRALIETALRRIAAAEQLGAFVSVNAELALSEADAADARITATPPGSRAALAALLGVPTAHKDLVAVRGTVTTHGSAAVPHPVAAADDPVAAAVRAAGAISLGKTQVPEFGIAAYSENAIAPPARNPFDPSRSAGGSSGGTAAAVAAGLIPGAIASDAGGSIRIPAAACGLVGLKPGRGSVPADRAPVAAADPEFDGKGAPRMAVSGPIARTALDAAVLYDPLLREPGEPALAAVSLALEHPETLRGLRVGVSLASPFESRMPIRFDADARAAVESGIRALEAYGHRIEEARIAYDPSYPDAFTTVWTAGLSRIAFAPGAEERLDALAGMFLRRARETPRERLLEASGVLRSFARSAAEQWGAYDVVLTPALAFAPPRIGGFRELGPEGDYRLQCEWAPQTSMVNVAGLPAITVPTATDPDGIPRGIQLIGRAGSEILLLRLAAQLELARDALAVRGV